MNKNHIKNIFICIGICIICIVGIPILINILILKPRLFDIVGTSTDWLSFWGGYLGAIISAGVAFAILYIQRKDNEKQNMENRNENEIQNNSNRQLQLNIMKYQQQSHWLDNLRNVSLEYCCAFNNNDIIMVSNIMLNNPNEAFMMIKPLFDRINNANAKFMFLRKQNVEVDELSDNINIAYKAYKQSLHDLQWIALYLKDPKNLHEWSKEQFISFMQYQETINKNIDYNKNLFQKEFGNGKDYFNKILKVIIADNKRIEPIVINLIYEYLKQEQKRIDNLLIQN